MSKWTRGVSVHVYYADYTDGNVTTTMKKEGEAKDDEDLIFVMG